MIKTFELKRTDNNAWDGRVQKVWSDNTEEYVYFDVCDLNECPEDAIIGRNLFTADDFIEAVKLGFRIAKHGYDEITVTDVPWFKTY